MEISASNVLIIKYTSLPEEQKARIKDWLGFSNDCLLPYSRRSEFSTRDLSQASLEQYHADQSKHNDYKGTLEQFIEYYNLGFDAYLIQELPKRNINISDYEELYIDISW